MAATAATIRSRTTLRSRCKSPSSRIPTQSSWVRTALGSDWQAALDGLDKDVNAVAVELKDASGKIYYESKVQGAIDCGAVSRRQRIATRAIQGLGRLGLLHDRPHQHAARQPVRLRAHDGRRRVPADGIRLVRYEQHPLARTRKAGGAAVCDRYRHGMRTDGL